MGEQSRLIEYTESRRATTGEDLQSCTIEFGQVLPRIGEIDGDGQAP